MPKLKYSEELKLEVIHYVLDGHSMTQAAKKFYVGKKTVQKWMDAYRVHGINGIRIKQNDHNKYTGDFKVHVTAENKLKRDFNATAPNQKWSTDVTEFKIPGEKKKLYLSAILDLYDRYPVSYVISCRNDNRLVFRTYDKAIASNPDAKPIFHSNRGFQYTSRVFQQKLKEQEIEQSMSRVAHCIDNGPTEGF